MPETYAETPLLTERFDRAMALALAYHRPQLRKSTKIPYVFVAAPLRVQAPTPVGDRRTVSCVRALARCERR